jgi:hypothetical protein
MNDEAFLNRSCYSRPTAQYPTEHQLLVAEEPELALGQQGQPDHPLDQLENIGVLQHWQSERMQQVNQHFPTEQPLQVSGPRRTPDL